MPTFPSSPLKFRTAGFPQYGFKAGFPRGPSCQDTDVSYPASLLPAFVLAAASVSLRTVSESLVAKLAPPRERFYRSTPGVLAPVRVLLSRSFIAYSTPSAPLAGTSRLRCLATYTPCPRCAFPPRRPTSGSALSLSILCSTCRPLRPREVRWLLAPSSFTTDAGLRPIQIDSALPSYPANPFHAGHSFSRLHSSSLALRPVDLLARLTDLTRLFAQPTGTFTSGLPTVWLPAPSPDITTVATG
jgi:hypothetical protein